MAQAVIKRKDAIAAGLKRYFTGKPCPHGHIAERYVPGCRCVECTTISTLKWSRENTAAIAKRRFERNPDYRTYQRDKTRAYRLRNPGVDKEYKRRFLTTPEGKAANAAYASKRRAVEMQRTPAWADTKAIKEIYVAAALKTATTGTEYHVDHVVPLQGKLVSGLHVADNLQLLPAKTNMSKHNKFEITT